MSNWRTEPVERTCRHCEATFVGVYNSRSCPDCKQEARNRANERFREGNPGYWRKWQEANQNRHTRIEATYGLTEEQWLAMKDAQNGGCAICGRRGGWRANAGLLVVDHDHKTGRVRGLLCPPCNRGLGQFEDSDERLLYAALYLSRSS